ADRLVFVNRHDLGMQRVSMSSAKRKYEPFEEVTLSFQAPADTRHISIAVRDGMTDETTFDTGNMLTDFLLSSELKGFVANADYYFAADDDEHRSALDLLMMVQGWRRYDYEEIVRTRTLRYAPELTLTVEGKVYKMRHFDEITIDDASLLKSAPSAENAKSIYSARAEAGGNAETVILEPNNPDPYFGANNSDLRHEVTVSGELVCGKRIAEVELETDNHGHFLINVPPFYGDGILFLSAFDSNASDKKLHRLATHQTHNEKEAPAYYVRRDLFYPVFAKPYSFYQCHFPDDDPDTASAIADSTDIEVDRISTMDTQLENVNVDQKRRRGRVRIDYTKPACVYDAVELYNLATDYGLSHGMVNFRRLPMQLAILLFGNYNNHSTLNVQAQWDRDVFYRNFIIDDVYEVEQQFLSDGHILNNLRLDRQRDVRMFTDFELRNSDKYLEQSRHLPDIVMDFVLMPNGSHRVTTRDRRITLHGVTHPVSFYNPDYSQSALPLSEVKDYRRTLYWNPNARPDESGRFDAHFFNNSKQTSIRVSVAGLTDQGQPLVLE
ncbi:MAG: hypothetical protein KBT20_11590, partial [Bacteroidales bacterium]|nr:hypothetical protein [Candidatus Liminaster caballi]